MNDYDFTEVRKLGRDLFCFILCFAVVFALIAFALGEPQFATTLIITALSLIAFLFIITELARHLF